jgi:hypothetical protein
MKPIIEMNISKIALILYIVNSKYRNLDVIGLNKIIVYLPVHFKVIINGSKK